MARGLGEYPLEQIPSLSEKNPEKRGSLVGGLFMILLGGVILTAKALAEIGRNIKDIADILKAFDQGYNFVTREKKGK